MLASVVSVAVLVRMELDSGDLRLCNALHSIEWNGETWIGVGLLCSIEPIKETIAAEAVGYKLTMASARTEALALALQENPQGRRCTIYVAIADPDTGAFIGDPDIECVGLIDQFIVSETPDSGIVTVTVENELVDLHKPLTGRMTHSDQQQKFPGDMFFQYVADMTERAVKWPSKEYFY